MRALVRVACSLWLCLPLLASAASVGPTDLDPAMEQRYKHMIAELRCLVCQNQSLADSDADLAKDLRQEVLEMMDRGMTDEEILKFLTDRYGDFVLYRPPVKTTTMLLWAGPFLFLVVGGALLAVMLRRRARVAAPAELSPEERKRLGKILHEEKQA